MGHPIGRQIASLEVRVLSLREALATLPADQRAMTAADLVRLRAALVELQNVFSTIISGEVPQLDAVGAGQAEFPAGEDELIWSAERTTRLYAISTALSVALT